MRVKELLKEQNKSKYWLYKHLGLSYQNFNKIYNNKTISIRFDNLITLCKLLHCTPNDLFEEYYKKDLKK
jgi:putative transcriptional regulator